MNKKICVVLSLLLVALCLSSCNFFNNGASSEQQFTQATADSVEATEETTAEKNDYYSVVYSDNNNWAYLEENVEGKDADVFFLAPTMYGGSEEQCNMSLDDKETKAGLLGTINMEKGIYDDNCRFFAPYYKQIGNNVYRMPIEDREPYLQVAFSYVKDAFEYYMAHYNNGRPIVVAGFSQGADMSIRLIKECFATEERQKQLVACYAIGWNITYGETQEYPHLNFAQGEMDTGVVIAFNTEAKGVESSLMIPQGMKTLAINPLNWKTDDTYASAQMNLGSCFTNYDGEIVKEIEHLTGAYIEGKRGALVVDITPDTFPDGVKAMEDGIYHIYDFQFFYRNLEKNVQTRIDVFLQNAQQREIAEAR